MNTAPAEVAAPVPFLLSRWTTLQLATVWIGTGAAYGCVAPFLTVYAARRGLSVSEIGLLSAAAAAVAAGVQPLLGRALDRSGRPRPLLLVTVLLGAAGCLGLGLVSAAPLLALCATLVITAFFGARAIIIPTTMTAVERAGQGAAMFARYRLLPSLGYTVTGLGGGLLLSHLSFALIFGGGALCYLIAGACSRALPAPAPDAPARVLEDERPAVMPLARRVLLTLSVVAVLAGIITSCADTYVPLLMRHLQGSFFQVGLASTLVTLADMPLLIIFGRLADRNWSALLVVLGTAVLPLRCACYFLVQAPMQLLSVQLLDGPSFAASAIAGTILLKDQTPLSQRAWTLNVYAAAGTLGPIAGPLLAGLLAARVGLQPMFGLVALGALAVPAIVALGLWPLLRPPVTPDPA